MYRVCAFSFLLLLPLSNTRGFIEQFVCRNSTPKCCAQDEILINATVNFTSYECDFDRNKSLQILAGANLESDFSNSLLGDNSCIDVLENLEGKPPDIVKLDLSTFNFEYLNLTYFPKCCPPNYAYDLREHRCVEDGSSFEILNSFLNESVMLIRAGLSDCNAVIADYEVSAFDESLFNEKKELLVEELGESVPFESYCLDKAYDSESYVARVCHPNFDVCKKSLADETKPRCIKKCCPDGKLYRGKPRCGYDFEHGLNFSSISRIPSSEEPFHAVHGQNCNKYMVPKDWNWTLDELGYVILLDTIGTFSPFEQDSYCFENVNFGANEGLQLFLCFETENLTYDYKINRIALLLSCMFLILTLLGYSILPEMRNLHGKTLMCHCVSLLIAFLTLSVIQFYPNIVQLDTCIAVGYFLMYTTMSAFMWSNVMCFDIWWTFGCMRIQGVNYKRKELKRFLWYCLYSWGVPVILTGITFCIQHFGEHFPESMEPFIPTLGTYTCFFEQRSNIVAFLTWYILPIALVSVCNLVLFIKTIRYCYKVKGDIEKMKDTQAAKNEKNKILTADKEKLKFASKLFLVMGISWIFEVISSCAIPANPTGVINVIFKIIDAFDCLQGVFIFCIFILKRKFIHAVKKKLGVRYSRRTSQSITNGITTGSTYVPIASKV